MINCLLNYLPLISALNIILVKTSVALFVYLLWAYCHKYVASCGNTATTLGILPNLSSMWVFCRLLFLITMDILWIDIDLLWASCRSILITVGTLSLRYTYSGYAVVHFLLSGNFRIKTKCYIFYSNYWHIAV